LALPPTIKFDQLVGFTNSMAKLMLNGRSAEIIETTKSELKYLKELL
jgi:pyruvate dehydrogenase (quinone)